MRIALAVVLLVLAPLAGAESFPTRVLITNDNGIDDPKIIALARRFAPHVETWVIAPDQDRSGSGSHLPGVQAGVLNAEPRDLGDNIKAWAVDGLPADCVILALVGIMIDNPPDLVISGINGGANLGHDWMFSGTIGAARVAALGGIPSIAVSGLNDDLPGAVEAATDWVFRLAMSDAVRSLEPGDFLTASLPRTVPGEIRGVQVADRGPPDRYPVFAANPEVPGQWRVTEMKDSELEPPQPNDRSLHADGWIVVVPMRVDEVKRSALSSFPMDSLPQWTGAWD